MQILFTLPLFSLLFFPVQDPQQKPAVERIVIGFQYLNQPTVSSFPFPFPPIGEELNLISSKTICEKFKISSESRRQYKDVVDQYFKQIYGRDRSALDKNIGDLFAESEEKIEGSLTTTQKRQLRETWHYLKFSYFGLPEILMEEMKIGNETLIADKYDIKEIKYKVEEARKELDKNLRSLWADCVDSIVEEWGTDQIVEEQLAIWKSPYSADISSQIFFRDSLPDQLTQIEEILRSPLAELVKWKYQAEYDASHNFEIRTYEAIHSNVRYILEAVTHNNLLDATEDQLEKTTDLLLEYQRLENEQLVEHLQNGSIVRKHDLDKKRMELTNDFWHKFTDEVLLPHQIKTLEKDLQTMAAVIYGVPGMILLEGKRNEPLMEFAKKRVLAYAREAIILEDRFRDFQLEFLDQSDRLKIKAAVGERSKFLLPRQTLVQIQAEKSKLKAPK